tara:strand:- start:896 stop:1189 length:294 start_codon:yes stop_codon:yes gene_type:complete
MKTRSEIYNNKTIKIYLSPTDTGFSCSIDNKNSKNMSFDEFEMVNTIAHGLIHLATTEPESAFSMGLSVLRKNKKKIIMKINKNNQSNIINFLDYKK